MRHAVQIKRVGDSHYGLRLGRQRAGGGYAVRSREQTPNRLEPKQPFDFSRTRSVTPTPSRERGSATPS